MLHHRMRATSGAVSGIPYDYFAFYKMDAFSGSSVTDETGNHNGTKGTGVTSVSGGKFDNAASFNGSTSAWIDVPSNAIFNGDLSISFWIKAPTPSNIKGVFYKAPDTGFNRVFEVTIAGGSGSIAASTSNGSSVFQALSSTPINNSEFTHCCTVFSPISVSLYINGILESSVNITGTRVANTEKVTFGRVSSASTSARFLDGQLDHVRFYNRVLDPSEITALANEA